VDGGVFCGDLLQLRGGADEGADLVFRVGFCDVVEELAADVA